MLDGRPHLPPALALSDGVDFVGAACVADGPEELVRQPVDLEAFALRRANASRSRKRSASDEFELWLNLPPENRPTGLLVADDDDLPVERIELPRQPLDLRDIAFLYVAHCASFG